jgi:hypothetical protein
MKSYQTCFYILAVILLTGIFYNQTFAQSSVEEAARINGNDIEAIMDPETPGAMENVTITLSSFLTDMDRAFVIWKVNGKNELSGTGKKKFTFTTNDIGTQTVVDISIRATTGDIINKRINIAPAEINILWEGADSYTPPFYRGRALPGPEGLIRVVALPQVDTSGIRPDPSTFAYTWKRNTKVNQDASGYGKDSFVFQQSYLNEEEEVTVEARGTKTNFVGSSTKVIRPFNPKILFYEKDPIFGIKWNTALSNNLEVRDAEKTILAEPYFVSPKNPTSGQLKYIWTINNGEVSTPSVPNVLTIKKGAGSGTAKIDLDIRNILKIFMEVSGSLTINLK